MFLWSGCFLPNFFQNTATTFLPSSLLTMRDNDSFLVDVDGVDFKLAFKAALIFTLGQRQPLLSAMIKETDLKRSISTAARQLEFDEDELKKAKKEIKELRKSLESERRRGDDLEDELKDSGEVFKDLRDSTETYSEEKADLRERLDYEIMQCRENSALFLSTSYSFILRLCRCSASSARVGSGNESSSKRTRRITRRTLRPSEEMREDSEHSKNGW